MVDFTGIAAQGLNVPSGMQTYSLNEEALKARRLGNQVTQQQLLDAARVRAAQAAAARAFTPNNNVVPGSQPITYPAIAPGTPSPPATTQAANVGPGPGAVGPPVANIGVAPRVAPIQGAGASPAAAPSNPPGPPPAMAPTAQPMARPNGGIPPMPLGGYDLPTMMRIIRSKNPGIDDQTAFEAAAQATQLLNPQGKAELQYMMRIASIDAQNSRFNAGQAGQDRRQQMRIDAANAALTKRDADALDRVKYREASIDRRVTGPDGAKQLAASLKTAISQSRADLQAAQTDLHEIIQDNGGGIPQAGDEDFEAYQKSRAAVQALIKERDGYYNELRQVQTKWGLAATPVPGNGADAGKPGSPAAAGGTPTAKPTAMQGDGSEASPFKPMNQKDYDSIKANKHYIAADGVTVMTKGGQTSQ